MRASVVTCRDTFRPANHRSVDVVRRRRSLRALAPRTRLPVICQVNGQWMPRRAWSRRVDDGDLVVFVTLPQGGGGGGSNPLRAVLMIAVMVFAAWAAPAIGAAMGVGTFGTGVIQGAIGLVGSALINALVPAAKATAASTASSLAAASPTYSLSAQGNQARIGQPIPVMYGRHLIYPDFAAQPYTEYAGNEQYLYELFCVGQGYYDIESIRIDDSNIYDFPEVTTQIVQPGEAVTLFPSNVVTSTEVSGQEALPNTVLGPFVVNAAGTAIDRIAIDIVFPRGLYYAQDSGALLETGITWTVQVQRIDDDGFPLDGWVEVGNHYHGAATTTPIRLSMQYSVGLGRYRVRLQRTSFKETDSRFGQELDWAGLRGYIPGSQVYGDVTMLAVRMRATNSLSAAASRKVNLIATRKLPVWNGSAWSVPVATRSIAWAIADICRAQYGGKMPDARIDLAGLVALDAILASRGDTFNYVADSQSTVGETLTISARAGRAIWYKQGGIVHFVRDQPATLPVALFTPRNIAKGSLTIDYLMTSEETADAIDVTYFDDRVWAERTVRAALPGSAQAVVAAMKLPGVTSRAQAWKEGMYAAACNRYRRRFPTWQTEMEGFVPTLGDLVALSHDLPKWGQSGEIVAWNAATKTATLSEPLTWTSGATHMLAFRGRDGSLVGPYYAMAGADAYHVVLTDWALKGSKWSDGTTDKAMPDVGGDRERSHFAFGPVSSQYIRARLLSVKPRSSETVELAAVIESDYVHTADTGAVPSDTAWQLPTRITRPTVVGLSVIQNPVKPTEWIAAWQPSPTADHYIVEQSSGNGVWYPVGTPAATSISAEIVFGADTLIRVAAVGVTRGAWAQSLIIGYQVYQPPTVTGFAIEGQNLSWEPVVGLSISGVVIRFQYGVSLEWGTANPVHAGVLTSSPYAMTTRQPGTITLLARAVDTFGNESAESAYIITELGDTLTANIVETVDYRALGWPGDTTAAEVVGGDLVATQSDPFYRADASDFFPLDGEGFYSGNYDAFSWESPEYAVFAAASGSAMTVSWSATGSALALQYRQTGPNPFYVADDAAFYGADDAEFWEPPGSWKTWPGAITARNEGYQWRVSADAGRVAGSIAAFVVSVDVPDKTVEIADFAIGAGGARLPVAGQFDSIKNVQLTLQGSSSAVKIEVLDKSAILGPLVQAKDSSGAGVSATVDATIKGY